MTELLEPYGGRLVRLLLSEEESTEQLRMANALPFVQLSDRSLNDLELLAVGAFSPLDRFMGRADYERVLKEMRLGDGTFWRIPITLPVQTGEAIYLGKDLALRNARNELIAVMTVEEVFPWNLETETASLLGQVDSRHPLVTEMSGWGPLCISGPLRVFHLPKYHDFADIRRTPAQVRCLLQNSGLRMSLPSRPAVFFIPSTKRSCNMSCRNATERCYTIPSSASPDRAILNTMRGYDPTGPWLRSTMIPSAHC